MDGWTEEWEIFLPRLMMNSASWTSSSSDFRGDREERERERQRRERERERERERGEEKRERRCHLLFSFQELQHEVSSLLEFKNALLETFPHLQGKLMPGPQPSPISRNSVESSTTTNHPPLVGPVQSSHPSQRRLEHVSDGDATSSSWNNTLTRGPRAGAKVRKSPETSSSNGSAHLAGDSGFCTADPAGLSRTAAAAVPHPPHEGDDDDDLLHLLDIIHRKAVRLRRDFAVEPGVNKVRTGCSICCACH